MKIQKYNSGNARYRGAKNVGTIQCGSTGPELLKVAPCWDAEAPLLPDAVVLAVRRGVEIRRDHAAHVVPRTDLHHHLLVDDGHVRIGVRQEDSKLAPGVDAVASPDRGQRRYLLLQIPVEHVVVELDACAQQLLELQPGTIVA